MKIAIAGTGMIVPEALKALREVDDAEVVAIFARPQSVARGRELAQDYAIPQVFTDYARMLAESGADAVYVANINSVHHAYCLEALRAGKHVMVEKPFCDTAAEVREVVEQAQANGLLVMEMLTFLHAPFFDAIRRALPQLGRIRMVQANYSKFSSRYPRYLQGDVAPVFDPRLAGGALMDLNIYNLNFVTALFGAPQACQYTANLGFNGIDLSGVAMLQYPDFIANLVATKDSASPGFLLIQGEEGWLRVNGSPDDFRSWEVHAPGLDDEQPIDTERHRMIDEFADFCRIHAEGDTERCAEYARISLTVAELAETMCRAVGLL